MKIENLLFILCYLFFVIMFSLLLILLIVNCLNPLWEVDSQKKNKKKKKTFFIDPKKNKKKQNNYVQEIKKIHFFSFMRMHKKNKKLQIQMILSLYLWFFRVLKSNWINVQKMFETYSKKVNKIIHFFIVLLKKVKKKFSFFLFLNETQWP